jgi:hypothetical protein
MKTLALAFIIVLLSAGACFALLNFAGVGDKVAAPLASALLGAITYVHQTLDQKKVSFSLLALPQGIVTLRGFFLPSYVMFVYGAFLLLAIMNIGGAIGGIAAALSGLGYGELLFVAAAVSTPLALIGSYLIGRWIGVRSAKLPLVVAILAIAGARLGGSVMDWLVLPTADFEAIFHAPKEIKTFLEFVGGGVIFLAIPALLGAWRGRRARLAGYLRYLLKRIPQDTRLTIVNLAFEEADKATGGNLARQRFVDPG